MLNIKYFSKRVFAPWGKGAPRASKKQQSTEHSNATNLGFNNLIRLEETEHDKKR